jgi:uncharacterized membrane protein YiaA
MKKLLLPIMLIAIIVGLYEQTNEKPNLYILSIAIVVFMFGMMQLSSKTPSKNSETAEEKEDEDE